MPDSVSTDDRVARSSANQKEDSPLAPSQHLASSQTSVQLSEAEGAYIQRSDVAVSAQCLDAVTQAVEQLYTDRLGRKPKQVSCDLLPGRLVIWVEESVTPVDQLLYAESDEQARSL